MTQHRHALPAIGFYLALILFGCGAAGASVWTISIGEDDQYHPSLLNIAVGDSVCWANQDRTSHTATSGPVECIPDLAWDSGEIQPGSSWGRVFHQVGSFRFFCLHHCSTGMTGAIVVGAVPQGDRTSWSRIKEMYMPK
jgi:plastocyanin